MRTREAQPDTLYVRMLGGFSMTWNGKLIAGGSKASESQFTYLLQILIHNRARGVTRDRLEELLFEDREMDNVHHALQSVIYNSKKKLERAGLPKVNYIEQRKGVFFWTEELPLMEDASEFERLYAEAERAADLDEKLALYMDAVHSYGGEFLP
ncbi:MAG: winged helix-turn-helix domain-containing protein, partial [Oscillospiraceae bacterium]|nr:winged helix-turn-helix domain-containing protein [Oscillospiraceae bacterium]